MKQHPLRIAVIEPVGGHGGMHYYDFGLCSGLAAAGIDVVLHTCDETISPKDAIFEVRHTYTGIYGKAPTWRRGLRYIRGSFSAVWSAMREGRCICHFHLFHVGSRQVFNVGLSKLLRRRIVVTAHDVESFVESLDTPALSRWVYRQVDRVIAHNKISQQELVDKMGLPVEKIAVIPHGNYLHAIHPLPLQDKARRDLGVEEHSKVILFFGQIKDVKGLDLLLEAMPGVLKEHPDAVLLIAGKPWKCDFSAYEAQMEEFAVHEHCITHIRYIDDKDVPLYYSAADVVALPYRRIYQSGVILMAMSYAKAVLVSDLPGMTEIVTDDINGYVFRTGDASDLAQRLCAVLEDRGERHRLAEQGYQHIRENYAWKTIGKKTGELYASILE